MSLPLLIHSRARGRRGGVLACVLAALVPAVASGDTVQWQALYGDGFESGGFGAWDLVANTNGDLTVTADAALTGSFGMQAHVDDTGGLFVQDDTPADEAYYRASFSFDPNAFDPGEAQSHFRTRIFIGFEDGPRRLFAIVLRRLGGQYAIRARARLDDNRQADTPFVPITDAAHRVDLRWKRSSGATANDGYLELYIDFTPAATLSGLDNSISSVDFVRMGALSVKPGASGVLYWDDFASDRRADPLFCESPADGTFVTVTPGITAPLTGRSRGLTDVHVNGVPVAVAPDGTFAADVPSRYGLHFVELSGLDAGRPHTALCAFVGSVRYAAEGADVDDAIAFSLEATGVQKLLSHLPPWYARPAFAQGLDADFLAANPWLDMTGGGSSAEARYQSLTYALDSVTPSIVNSSTLNVRVQMDLRVNFRVTGTVITVPFTTTGTLVFNNLSVDYDVQLLVDAVTSRIRFQPNTVNVNVGAYTVEGFTGPPPALLASWLNGDAPGAVLGMVIPRVLEGAGLFSGLTDGLRTLATGESFPVNRLDGSGTVDVTLATSGRYARWASGAIDLGTSLALTEPALPGASGPVPLPTGADPMTYSIPGTDAWASFSGGGFNLVLRALWRAGLFDGTVPGASLDPALPAGTSVDVKLRTMPIVTGFVPGDGTRLDVGSLDLAVTHPALPSGLRVRAGGRLLASSAMVGNDLVFDGLVVEERHIATGDVTLGPAAQTALEALVTALLVRIGDAALNDSLPAFPMNVFDLAPAMSDWGLPGGTTLSLSTPSVIPDNAHVFLVGGLID